MLSLDHVGEIIADRPVAIVVPGPTVVELTPFISGLAELDICWVGVSKFWYVEQEILAPHAYVQVVWSGSSLAIASDKEHIYNFVYQDKYKTIFVTKSFAFESLRQAKVDLNKVVLYNPPRHCNALSALLVMLRKLECDKVFIFGADGGPVDGKLHFGQEVFEKIYPWYKKDASGLRLQDEADKISSGFERSCELSGADYDTDFINASVNSRITCFQRTSYLDASAQLLEYCESHGFVK